MIYGLLQARRECGEETSLYIASDEKRQIWPIEGGTAFVVEVKSLCLPKQKDNKEVLECKWFPCHESIPMPATLMLKHLCRFSLRLFDLLDTRTWVCCR